MMQQTSKCEDKESSGMMMKETNVTKDSMSMLETKSEDKEETPYRKMEKIFKERSHAQKFKKKNIENREISKKLIKKAIDFENNVIPSEYLDIVQEVTCDSFKKVYSLKTHPGFFFVVNPFQPQDELHWIKMCLNDYPQLPNITNLDFHYGPVPDIWKNAQTGDPKSVEFLNKLSWATLGYQYAWTERKYTKEKFVEFPKDIASVVAKIANSLGWDPYFPEAAIINYYDISRCMGGHLDNAEYEMEKPIVSLSFGNSAIFMLGGEDRFSEPIPLIIRSGDVVVMGGRSRWCFHGVPRILEDTLPTHLHPDNVAEEYKPYCQYMLSKRLNINTRQVYKEEKK